MSKYLVKRNKTRKKRAFRVRKNIRGTAERPRLSVQKTNKHLFFQLIDDQNQRTLLGLGTVSKEVRQKNHEKKTKTSAQFLGKLLAEKAKEKNIKEVVFDRGRFRFCGLIAELATEARNAGLKF